jgi:AraC-like DNA-binding protein
MHSGDTSEKIVYVDNLHKTGSLFCALAGVTNPSPDYKISRYPTKEYIIEYIISGHGYIETAEETIPVSGGTLCVIRKGANVSCYSDTANPYTKIWLNLDGDMLVKAVDMFVHSDVYTVEANVYDIFLEMHSRLSEISDENRSDMYAEIMALIFRLFTMATKDTYFPRGEDGSALDEKIRAYIDANVYNDVSLDDISEKFGITKMHIIRVFKKKFGTTPGQYLIDRRVSIAQSLLTSTIMPIKEISSLLRYSNTQHFSSSFKSAVGCTPGKYRQNNT